MELEKTYSSLQQEVEVKTRKLRKLFAKLQTIKQVKTMRMSETDLIQSKQGCGYGCFGRIWIRIRFSKTGRIRIQLNKDHNINFMKIK